MVISAEHPGWQPRLLTRTAIGCTRDEFLVDADLEAFEGNRRIFSRSWTRRVPRKLV